MGNEIYKCPTCGKVWFGLPVTTLEQAKKWKQMESHLMPCDECDECDEA